jgi:hypothetical protein
VELLLGILIFAILVLPIAILIHRGTELFVLRVQSGKVVHVRGRLPPRLLEDIRDVLEKPGVPDAFIRVVTDDGKPRVLPGNTLNEMQTQQLRNIVGTYRTPQIRSGRRPG